jgi:hypothetical protein
MAMCFYKDVAPTALACECSSLWTKRLEQRREGGSIAQFAKKDFQMAGFRMRLLPRIFPYAASFR